MRREKFVTFPNYFFIPLSLDKFVQDASSRLVIFTFVWWPVFFLPCIVAFFSGVIDC